MIKNKIIFFLGVALFVFLSLIFIQEEVLSLEKYKKTSSQSIDVLKSEVTNLKNGYNNSSEQKNNDSRQVMEKFLESDLQGSKGSEADEIMIIKSYEVVKSEIGDSDASFTVKYKCAGGGYLYDNNGNPAGVKSCDSYFVENDSPDNHDITVDQKNSEETVIFKLEKSNGDWKVISPTIPPHISIEVFLARTKMLLGDSANMDIYRNFFTKK